MRAVDLAVYADALAGEAAALAARIERAQAQLRQSEIERQARVQLPSATVERLQSLGYLRALDHGPLCRAIEAWSDRLDALEELQAWVESELTVATAA